MENCRKKSISYSEHKIAPGLSALSYNNARCNINRTDLKKILFKTPNSKKTALCLSAKKKQTPNGQLTNDRYIPSRVVSNMEIGYHLLHSNDDSADRENQVDYVKKKLINDTCNGLPDKARVLNIHNKQESDEKSSLYLNSLVNSVKKNSKRYISPTPERILDAPDFRNDYYLNLIDWSSDNNLAVALNTDMYIWSAPSGEISQLFALEEDSTDYICSTAWQPNKGNILAVGNSKNIVELWDVNAQRCLRVLKSQKSRIGSMSWNNFILTSGSRSGEIHHHDVRVAQHHVGTLKMHEQEVCGLKWSSNGRHLASGGNDNLAIVWDSNYSNETSQPLHVFREHTAAVKALAWCPFQSNLLATGGGTSDGHIKLWNVSSGNLVQSIDSKSQISCLLWSKYYKELISSHGYSTNQLTIWRYPDMTPVADLLGHQNRVLMMAMSPDGEMIASVGADETLRLWRCFTVDEKIKKSKDASIVKNHSYTSLSRCIR